MKIIDAFPPYSDSDQKIQNSVKETLDTFNALIRPEYERLQLAYERRKETSQDYREESYRLQHFIQDCANKRAQITKPLVQIEMRRTPHLWYIVETDDDKKPIRGIVS